MKEIYPNEEISSFFTLLAEHFLGFSKTDLILKKNSNLSESELLKFHYALKDLKKQKPLQYITGKQFFYDHDFVVSEHTLVPRPETEELVDLIVKENPNFEGSLLDIGTGTGAIAISLDKALINAKVTAFDVSDKALETAELNSENIGSRVDFQFQDILNPSYTGGSFDIIVSNPPYVLNSEKELMKPNVLDFEPHLALFVEDTDPLLFYSAIVDFCKRNLKTGGKIYFEINEQYGIETAELLKNNSFTFVEIIKDMQGKPRIVKGIMAK